MNREEWANELGAGGLCVCVAFKNVKHAPPPLAGVAHSTQQFCNQRDNIRIKLNVNHELPLVNSIKKKPEINKQKYMFSKRFERIYTKNLKFAIVAENAMEIKKNTLPRLSQTISFIYSKYDVA